MGRNLVRKIAEDPVQWLRLLVVIVCLTATAVAWAHIQLWKLDNKIATTKEELKEEIANNKLNNAVLLTKLEALEKGQEEIKRLVRK